MGSVLFLSRVAGDVVHALILVEGGHKVVIVGVVVNHELHLGEVALAVGKLLGHVNAEHVEVAIVNQRIVIAGVAALPLQDDVVVVALITVDDGAVGIDPGLVGDAHGAVAVAGVDHLGTGIDGLAGVDLVEAGGGHLDGHHAVAVGGGVIAHEEAVAGFGPGRDPVGACFIFVELQHHIALHVVDALAQGIHKGIVGQIAGSGGDAGQGGDDLIVDQIACRGGVGMGILVGFCGSAAAQLHHFLRRGLKIRGFAQGLLQTGDTGQVFGIEGDVIDPALTAVVGVIAVDAGHRERDQEGIGGIHNHFGNTGLHQQVQTEGEIACGGVAVGVGLRHGDAVVVMDEFLQSILGDGGVGCQSVMQAVDQLVRPVVIHGQTVDSVVGRGIAIARRQTESCEKGVVVFCGLHAIKHLHMLNAFFRLGIGADVGDLEIRKLHALHGVAVSVAVGVERGDALGVAEHGLYAVFVLDAGADIGGIPDPILLRGGQIVFVQIQISGAAGVDSSLVNRSSRGGNGKSADHSERQNKCEGFFQFIHAKTPFSV